MQNKKIRTIIIEDEPLASETIVSFLQDIFAIEVLSAFRSAESAANFLRDQEVDLIITDINLPNISGIELVESFVNPPLIIVTTAYPEFAVSAYNLDILDYILKPITKSRLLKAINKVLRWYKLESINVDHKGDRLEYIFIKSEYKLIKINIEDILYLKAMGDYVQLVTFEKKVMTLQTLKYFSENLPLRQFHKIHRSYIVSVNKIKEIGTGELLIENDYLPVSENAKLELLEKMKDIIF